MITHHVYESDYAGIDPERSRCTYQLTNGTLCNALRTSHSRFLTGSKAEMKTHSDNCKITSTNICTCGFYMAINEIEAERTDMVDHPPHYAAMPGIDFECIEMIRWMSFNVGNACKYVWRAERKNGAQDLEKARWYVRDSINQRTTVFATEKVEVFLLKIVQCEETSPEKMIFFEAIRCRHLVIAELVLDLMIAQASDGR